MKKVLLTGGTGFLGRHAIPELLKKNYEVHLVSRRPQKEKNIFSHNCDLLSDSEIKELLPKIRPTHLLHFAWYVEPGKFWTSQENRSWEAASVKLFKHFAENGGVRAVFAGSCAEYDWSHDFLSEKNTPLTPKTLYGISKNTLRESLENASYQMNIPFAWGRIFFLYGPHEARQRLVSEAINNLLQNKPFPCTDGKQERDFMHVADVARAFVEVLESDYTGALNIASSKMVSIRQVVQTIGKILGKIKLIQWGAYPTPPDDPPRLAAEIKILREQIHFTPKYDLKTGLKQTIDWWKTKYS
jgi:nucleoside-diphosphate-sugar epimerase